MSGFSASKSQQAKVRHEVSIFSARPNCDPAHLWPRSRGGCDHADCVIPLTRAEHEQFDAGHLDLLATLIARGCWREMAHALEAHHVPPQRLLQRLTGTEWIPKGGSE